jgi:uncharacterized protein involved in outer membrane biogenesis
MSAVSVLRRGLKWVGWPLLALIILILLLAAALDAGYLDGPFVKFIASAAKRQITVSGPLRLHVFSLHPRLTAEHVTIGNPPWTSSGAAAEIGKVTMVLDGARLAREFTIERLEIENATLHMIRDAAGHANWQLKNPDTSAPQGLPHIRSVSMVGARMFLNDALKHRLFDGTASALDGKGPDGAQPLHIEGKGQLNGRAVTFELTGDPLRTASDDRHYAFSFAERSSGSHLTGSGFLLEPFDLHYFDASFEANGADLKDLYYLTGTKLIDTGSYHFSGKLARRGFTSTFSSLAVNFGQSDLRGSVSIEASKGLSNIDADLNSQSLRLSDLGPRAAGRDPEPESAQTMLLSATTFDPSPLRAAKATVKYRARHVDWGRVTFNSVAVKMNVDHGVLAVTPLSADVLDGKLSVQLKIDARKEIPAINLDVRASDLQLGQYAHKASAPPSIEGPLGLRANLTGHGTSMHEFAASAEGTVAATLPGGTVRESLAELTGIDLRGLGLWLTKNTKEVPFRCGIATFQVHLGTLTAKNLVLDTQPVLIAGEGIAHLDTETLDFVLRGYPKSVRLFRLRSPILIRGTLKHPSVGIEPQDSKLVLVDRGSAKQADCESMLR